MIQRRHGFTHADLLVVLLAVLLLSGVTVAQIVMRREQANRVKCASNLRQIGQAILLYENENRGRFPRTLYDPATADKPVWGTGNDTPRQVDPLAKDAPEKPNDVSAAMFLLMRTQDIGPAVFVCPSSNVTAWDFNGGTAQQFVNWPASSLAKHLSYSVANPYPSNAATLTGYRLNSALQPDFAVAADVNPGLIVPQDAPASQLKRGNSPNHNGEIENVLYGDGHVEAQTTPYCGSQHDNIYSVGGSMDVAKHLNSTTIIGSPVDATDSVLLPIAQGQAWAGDKGSDSVPVYPTTREAYFGTNPVSSVGLLGHSFVSKDGLEVTFVSPTMVDWIRPGQPIASGNVLMTSPERLRINLVLGGDSVAMYFRLKGTLDARHNIHIESLVGEEPKVEFLPAP